MADHTTRVPGVSMTGTVAVMDIKHEAMTTSTRSTASTAPPRTHRAGATRARADGTIIVVIAIIYIRIVYSKIL